jgi:hypothetical protein
MSDLFGRFWATTWKTRQKHPPIDWEVGEGGHYAFGLAWLIFTTAIVFWWFLQTYLTSGLYSLFFILQQKIASAAQLNLHFFNEKSKHRICLTPVVILSKEKINLKKQSIKYLVYNEEFL